MRYDYVKAVWELDHDMAQELGREWYDTFSIEQDAGQDRRVANVKQLRKMPSGKYLWAFEAWGEVADRVQELPWAIWAPHMQRMDVRDEWVLTHKGVDAMYQHLRQHKAGSKNVHLFDSRPTTKRQGRDTGGYGLALGSHKSDLRTTFYVRGHEGAAYEFQVAGDKLEQKISAINLMANSKYDNSAMNLWYQLQLALWSMGWGDTQTIFGLQREQIEVLSLGYEHEDDTVERKLAAVDAILDGIPKDALYSVLDSVQLRLL